MKPTLIPSWLAEKMSGINHFRLLFSDVTGALKEMNFNRDEITEVLQFGQGFDGSSIEGFVRLEESDLMAHPRPKSFRVLPPEISGNGKPVGIFFCDIRTPDGKPFPGDPRQCLKRLLRRAKHLGFTYYVGPELEFYICPDKNTPQPLDRQGYFDATTEGPGAGIVEETFDVLSTIGIQGECWHHEVAPGSFEIDVKYQEALTMADQVMLIRWILKRIAKKHGLYATFLPKPIYGENGSGMHVHMSLFKEGHNAFYSKRHPLNLSLTARRFMAGILKYVREFTLVTNPLVNSYKRIVPGYEAPCYISWGQRNRSSLIRVPRYRAGKEKSTRIELRSPDPTANPYLAFAVMLGAGLAGMSEKLKLPKPVEDNIFAMPPDMRQKMNIRMLPDSLQEAIRLAKHSTWLHQTLGRHIATALMNNQQRQWDDFRTHVTDWEIEHLMPRY